MNHTTRSSLNTLLAISLFAAPLTAEPAHSGTSEAPQPAAISDLFMVRLEAASDSGPAELYLDGWSVGVLPWSGSLTPGPHTFSVRRGDYGTAPAAALPGRAEVVIQDADLKPLGPEQRLGSNPPDASLTLNGVPIVNPWVGRLPLGKHLLGASHPDYGSRTEELVVTKGSEPQVLVELDGESSDGSLRAKRRRRSVELAPALLLGTNLGSEAEERCSTLTMHCTDQTPARGGIVSARMGLEFSRKLRFELGAGLIYLTKKQKRHFTDGTLPGFEPVSYDMSDKLRVRGPHVSLGMAFQQPVSESVQVGARVHLGLSQIFARYRTEGIMEMDGDSSRAHVSHSDAVQHSIMVFGWPELFASYRAAGWHVGAGAGALVVMNRAQRGRHGEIWPEPREPAPCDGIACAPPSTSVEGERPFGPTALFSLSLYGGLDF